MKTLKNVIILTDVSDGISPQHNHCEYVDEQGTRIFVPNRLIIRLYEMIKWDKERRKEDFEQYVEQLFEEPL